MYSMKQFKMSIAQKRSILKHKLKYSICNVLNK